MSGDNPLVTTSQYYKDPNFSVGKASVSKAMYANPPSLDKAKDAEMKMKQAREAREQLPPRNPYSGGYEPQPT